jgi:hypothetical protein
MMSSDVQTPSLMSILMRAVASLVPFAQSRRATRRRMLRWCQRQGFELLRWRDAKPFEGPSSWNADERHYRIQIIDAAGRRRAAYLTFARRRLLERCTEVLWDDSGGHTVPDARSSEDDGSGLMPVASLPR